MSVLICITWHFNLRAQLCTGSLGDPVVNITFGSGTNPGAPLGGGITNCVYVTNSCPNDGMYTIRNQVSNCFLNTWHNLSSDHTGNPNGYFMLVNASVTPSDFFVQQVNGLCPNTTYEFAAWILNMCNVPGTILPNVTFSIEKTDGTVLNSYNSGDIPVSSSPKWVQYGFYFKTPADITSVVIRMRNNAPGGDGNDLALDDITFRPCGPKVNAGLSGNSNNHLELCEGNNQVISIGSFVSAGYVQPVLQWQLSMDRGQTWKDIPGASSDTYLRSPTKAGEYWYRLTVAEAANINITSCRVASDPVSIIVHALPSIQLTANPKVCSGTPLTLTANINYQSPSPRKLFWSYPDPSILATSDSIQNNDTANTGQIIQVTNGIPLSGSGSYRLTVQNSYGCENSDSVNVVVTPRPVADFSVQLPACEKTAVAFSARISGQFPVTAYKWSFGDNEADSSSQPVHSYDTAATYVASLVVQDSNGCFSDTAKQQLIVHATPEPDFGLPKLCLSDPAAQFTDSSAISDHTEANFSYYWTFGDPNAVNSGSNESTLKNPQHQYATTGNYPVHLTVTSNQGCRMDTTKNFTLNGSQVHADFSVNNVDPLCSADSISITNNSTVNFGNLVRVSVSWDYSNNPALVYTDDHPYQQEKFSHSFASVVPAAGEDITVHLVAYSGQKCLASADKTIHVNRSPQIGFSELGNVCVNAPEMLLTQASDSSGVIGSGSYSGPGVKDSAFNPLSAGVGSHNITYTFVSSAGCSAQESQPIQVLPQPTVSAGNSKTIIKGSWTTLNGQAGGTAPLRFTWSPSAFTSDVSVADPKVNPPATTTFSLTVTSADGCENKDSVQIFVVNGLFIPNAFTPNGDGLNDFWRLPVLDDHQNTEVSIYDRWGKTVFHSIGPVVSWDGKCNGKPQPEGTYVYIVDLKSGSPVYKGTLTLIR